MTYRPSSVTEVTGDSPRDRAEQCVRVHCQRGAGRVANVVETAERHAPGI